MKSVLKNQVVDVEGAVQEILLQKAVVHSIEPKSESNSQKMLWIHPHLKTVEIAFFPPEKFD